MKEDCDAEVHHEIGTQLVHTSPVRKERENIKGMYWDSS